MIHFYNFTNKMRLVLVLLFVVRLTKSSLVRNEENIDDRVKYYRQLIEEGSKNAINYKLPTNNSYFFEETSAYECESDRYDFIVVGSGSAGSVVTSRLSEVSYWKILLIEAGDEENDFTDIPAMGALSEISDRNWGYYTTSQNTSSLGNKNNQIFYPRGKSIGGSTVINGVLYSRGTKEDFDEWALKGNPFWSYTHVLPYFVKSEKTYIDGDIGYHGYSGPLPVNYAKTNFNILNEAFVKAGKILNITYNKDFNGKTADGVSPVQYNVHQGKRQTTGRCFLDKAREGKNLKVLTKSYVTKVLLQNKIALGIEYVKSGKTCRVYANKEVILSAGAINTPQIMMLSGIGPAEDLKKMGINVIQDLPVGKNLQDHLCYSFLNFRTNLTVDPKPLDESIREFLNGKGSLTSAIGAKYLGFVSENNTSLPEWELVFLPPTGSREVSPIYYIINNLNEEIRDSLIMDGAHDFQVILIYHKNNALGEVTLKSNGPIDFPNINTNIFTDADEKDIDSMYRGIKLVLKLMLTEPFKKYNTTLVANIASCNKHEFGSKDYWHCAIRHLAFPAYHTTGTTRMGPNYKSGVVNSNLKVFGIKKLRVVDAGVIPLQITGHTSAATIMIAERAASFIKTQYNIGI